MRGRRQGTSSSFGPPGVPPIVTALPKHVCWIQADMQPKHAPVSNHDDPSGKVANNCGQTYKQEHFEFMAAAKTLYRITEAGSIPSADPGFFFLKTEISAKVLHEVTRL